MLDYAVSDGVCLLRLNAPARSALTVQLLEMLRAAVRQANEDVHVQGIVIQGAVDHFSTGADAHLFQQIATAEDAILMSRIFQDAFQEIEDSDKPVVAAVAGNVVGDALEFAMACHYRVAAAGSHFSMPEVNLGINPAAGGTQRLPRLVGPITALQMLLTAAAVDAAKALELGLIDAVFPNEQVLDGSRQLLRSAAVRKTRDQTGKLGDAAARQAIYENAEQMISRARPEVVAPRKILECVRTGLEESFGAGLQREQTALAECLDTPAARNKIHLFFASRQTGSLPELADTAPASIHSAAVVGVGTMGVGIAQALLSAGVRVTILDQNETLVQKGLQLVRSAFQRRVADGRLSRERAERMSELLTATSRWEDMAEVGLAMEAVFEDLAVKRSVLQRLEEVCPPHTIVATNTSTMSLDELAGGLRHSERLIGLHFFNPAQRMPLVEVIRRDATPPEVLATALNLCRAMHKTPVPVKSREGFVVNRILVPYLQESLSLLEEGAAAAEIDAAAVEFGLPLGPLALIDVIGLDILVHAQRVLHRAFRYHGPLSPIAVRLVQRGHLGQKTGAGLYRYESGSHTPLASGETAEVVAEVREEARRRPRDIGREEIIERLVLRMVCEAFRVLEDGIARNPADIDVAMVLGAGFPDFRGGVVKYARDVGLDKVRARLEQLTDQCGERFLPSKQMKVEKLRS